MGGPGDVLTPAEITAFVGEQLTAVDLDGRSLCVLVPDATRSCPLPLLLSAVHGAVHGRVTRLTVLVALGTHPGMTGSALAAHLGYPDGGLAERYPGTVVLNHEWWDPATFVDVGTIPADRLGELSRGMLHQQVDVRINRAVVEHDLTLIVGPVFPHEVVGFSGGNKYLFPGVSGRELIDVSHWLGALITSAEIIGRRGITPVRALIDEATSMVPGERLALSVVTRSGKAIAEPEEITPAGGQALAADPGWNGRVIPTFRPDRYLEPASPGWPQAVADLGKAADLETGDNAGFVEALAARRRYFVAHGAVSADHSHIDVRTDPLEPAEAARIHRAALTGEATAAEATAYRRHMLLEMARMSCDDGLVMTLHPTVHRGHSGPTTRRFGADTGNDIPIRAEFTDAAPAAGALRPAPGLPPGRVHPRRDGLVAGTGAAGRLLPERPRRRAVVVPRRPAHHPPLPSGGD